MSIPMTGLVAYNKAFGRFPVHTKKRGEINGQFAEGNSYRTKIFWRNLDRIHKRSNNLQQAKNDMITSFASGETQNVHELMISMQKASVAMNLTSAVRNKVIEAYKEMSKLQF